MSDKCPMWFSLPAAAALAAIFLLANILHQLFGAHQWSIAFERSYFEALAVLIVWVAMGKQA